MNGTESIGKSVTAEEKRRKTQPRIRRLCAAEAK